MIYSAGYLHEHITSMCSAYKNQKLQCSPLSGIFATLATPRLTGAERGVRDSIVPSRLQELNLGQIHRCWTVWPILAGRTKNATMQKTMSRGPHRAENGGFYLVTMPESLHGKLPRGMHFLFVSLFHQKKFRVLCHITNISELCVNTAVRTQNTWQSQT